MKLLYQGHHAVRMGHIRHVSNGENTVLCSKKSLGWVKDDEMTINEAWANNYLCPKCHKLITPATGNAIEKE